MTTGWIIAAVVAYWLLGTGVSIAIECKDTGHINRAYLFATIFIAWFIILALAFYPIFWLGQRVAKLRGQRVYKPPSKMRRRLQQCNMRLNEWMGFPAYACDWPPRFGKDAAPPDGKGARRWMIS